MPGGLRPETAPFAKKADRVAEVEVSRHRLDVKQVY
jgi:hypothetical protein